MNLGLIGGFAIAIASILISNIMEGGTIASLLNPSAGLLVIGGTIGATLISCGLQDVLAVPKAIGDCLKDSSRRAQHMVEELLRLARKARQSGILSLESEIESLSDPFLKKALQLSIDVMDQELVRSTLELEISMMANRRRRAAKVLETAGGYAPTMGIIGTVMGLIHVLGNLEDASKLGPAIAVAFMATFYGIATANVLWLPLASKVKSVVSADEDINKMILEGVLGIQAAQPVTTIMARLEPFLGETRGAKKLKEESSTVEAPTGASEASG